MWFGALTGLTKPKNAQAAPKNFLNNLRGVPGHCQVKQGLWDNLHQKVHLNVRQNPCRTLSLCVYVPCLSLKRSVYKLMFPRHVGASALMDCTRRSSKVSLGWERNEESSTDLCSGDFVPKVWTRTSNLDEEKLFPSSWSSFAYSSFFCLESF